MRCSEIFNKYFPANLPENLTVKNFENLLRINRVTATSLVSPCFWNMVSIYYLIKAELSYSLAVFIVLTLYSEERLS